MHNSQCPKPLEALILRLLAKDPGERPESAANVISALERIDLTAPVEERKEEDAGSIDSLAGRVIVTDVGVSADGEIVESITVRTDEGEELSMRLGEAIDLSIWGPAHLLGHMQTGKTLGFKIGVTYLQTPDGTIALELSE